MTPHEEAVNAVQAELQGPLPSPAANRPRWPLAIPPLIVVGVLVAFNYCDGIMSWGQAADECIKFAQKNDVQVAFDPDPASKMFVANQWLKGPRYVVVELAQKTKGKDAYQSRLCVIGGGEIQIPRIFEEWEWR
jgi:hypothetical protein